MHKHTLPLCLLLSLPCASHAVFPELTSKMRPALMRSVVMARMMSTQPGEQLPGAGVVALYQKRINQLETDLKEAQEREKSFRWIKHKDYYAMAEVNATQQQMLKRDIFSLQEKLESMKVALGDDFFSEICALKKAK